LKEKRLQTFLWNFIINHKNKKEKKGREMKGGEEEPMGPKCIIEGV